MGKNRESSGNAAGSPADVAPVRFGEIRFDARTGELRRNGGRGKAHAQGRGGACRIAQAAPELVTKEELFARVWDGKAVGDEALTCCIQELRRALDDDARQPRFIETSAWLSADGAGDGGCRNRGPSGGLSAAAADRPAHRRTAEMAELQRRLGLALAGQRQLVVIGEPGIGKSALASVSPTGSITTV